MKRRAPIASLRRSRSAEAIRITNFSRDFPEAGPQKRSTPHPHEAIRRWILVGWKGGVYFFARAGGGELFLGDLAVTVFVQALEAASAFVASLAPAVNSSLEKAAVAVGVLLREGVTTLGFSPRAFRTAGFSGAGLAGSEGFSSAAWMNAALTASAAAITQDAFHV
jgi:hypothetical protein